MHDILYSPQKLKNEYKTELTNTKFVVDKKKEKSIFFMR